jgi:RimJ/RimL family protein N-acetyltransferase
MITIDIPILESERLRLRAHRADDLDDAAAMWGDPIVTKHIGGRPSTREEVWGRLHRYLGHWAIVGYGFWCIEEKESRRFVGEIGFADFRRDLQPTIPDAPEIGWALTPSAHGRGFATEAVRRVLAWGDERFGERATMCIIDPGNVASRRVAAKCGYEEVGETTYKGETTILHRRAPRRSGAGATREA